MAEFISGLKEFRRGVVEEVMEKNREVRRRFVIEEADVMEEWRRMYEQGSRQTKMSFLGN